MNLMLDKTAWERVRFGDVVRNVNETTRDPQSLGIDRVVAMEHLDPGELAITRWGSADDGTTFTRRVRPGQTLFGKRRAYQRKVAYADFDAICSGDILTFEADPGRLLPLLLPFVAQSDPFFNHALGTSAGSLSPRTNWRDLANFEFDLPPIEEQQRIADLLWSVEESLRSTTEEVACVARLGDATLDDLLMRGVSDHGWTEQDIPSLITSGPRNGKSAVSNDEARGIPTLSISAVRNGQVLGGSNVKHIDVPPESVAQFQIRDGDFLIVRGNGNKYLTGRGGLVSEDALPAGCIYPDLLIRLRFDPRVMLPEFGAAQWNSESAHRRLLQNAKSTNGIWKINGKDIKSHSLVKPPIEEQRHIMERVRSVQDAEARDLTEIAALKSLRTTILYSVFGGAA